jgi:1,4-alpha-glucan branching enzyme
MKGPLPATMKKTTFSLEAPQAQAVLLAGSFTQWELGAIALKRLKSGVWKTTVALEPGSYRYRFIVDGHWHDDPACAHHEANPFGSEDCIVTV